ncbi:chorismate synthase [Ralstonia syzygii subsp. celebesensis]|uniref:Chorismate synthase n=1 Tax=blood disease bacterium R229 TaxID=741978 RepID=G2ZMI8_9RALS|nr:chorismate synthase [Ralstonia syzygii]CCA79814.1 chorismate synthase [blood disease bacterium R229]
MSGNTLGLLFSVTTFGESHGPAIGAVIDGCPPGMALSAEDIQPDLDRRKPGTSRHVTQRKEDDQVEILSGVFEGKTTGTPICLLIRNTDQRSKDYGNIVETFRPGHADYTYWHKYGIRDPRGGGRSSARLTAPVVAAGAVAKKWLREKFGVEIHGYMSQLGEVRIPFIDWNEVPNNPFFAPNAEIIAELETYMDALRKDGDSVGARIEVVATGVPVGWGEPLFDRLDADIAHAMMGLNAVKGVEIGAGFHAVSQRGSEHGDELTPEGFVGNNAGGILGGISTGQDISVSLAIKPTSSIRTPRRSIDKAGEPTVVETFGRHDPCVGIRATPIAESLLALVLIDHALRHRAQCGDVAVAHRGQGVVRPSTQATKKTARSRLFCWAPGAYMPT